MSLSDGIDDSSVHSELVLDFEPKSQAPFNNSNTFSQGYTQEAFLVSGEQYVIAQGRSGDR